VKHSTIRTLVAAAALAAAAVASGVPAAGQSAVAVVVDGRYLTLDPGPIERSGRVFVPLRGIFERLGATVVYQSGTINATKGRTTVSLQIGSTRALVDGQPQYFDVAPFIVGATTYVPLRFVAQSLGANVNYDNATRVVNIGGGRPPAPMPPPQPPRPAPAPPIELRAQRPAPGATVADRFALVAAEFSRSVDAATVRVFLDGANVSNRSGISASGFSYKPPAPLDFGGHRVRVTGNGPGGLAFDRSWTFTVGRPAPAPLHLTISQPAGNAAVSRSFVVRGNTVGSGRVRVTAGPTPASNGQFSGEVTAGPAGNFSITVSLNPLLGQQSVTLRITVTNPANGATTTQTLQLRLK